VRPRISYGFVIIGALVVTAALLVLYSNSQARRQATQQAHIHLQRGIRLFNKKAFPHAEAELRKALRANKQDWTAPFYLGAIRIEQKQHQRAIPFLERALTNNPQEPKILNALGVVYYNLGRLDMAKGYFMASIELDPTNTGARGLMESMAKLQWRAEQAASEED
jgi:Flp pilus assembly protein TadD